ncbi:MAG: Lrp/AsnC ligand binding domain-containing protein [candidate division KSB1 bacterium]|nr:Lrp/AsnC ligand binding domain-containing protein [candidate division KSB1 bacterium]
MSVKAYVLIETSRGRHKDVETTLRSVPQVKAAHCVIGPYDVIAFVEGEDLPEVESVVVDRVHSIDGVVRTTTCLVV